METDKKLPDNIINFKANGTHSEDESLPEALPVEPGNEKSTPSSNETQPLKFVGVIKKSLNDKDYTDVLITGFHTALEETKDEEYEFEIPLDEDRKEIDNVLENLFSDDLSKEFLKHAQLLLKSETDKNISPEDLSQAAAYFNELEYKVSRAKLSIIEKMKENYEITRTLMRGRNATAAKKVNDDMISVPEGKKLSIIDQIKDIVDIKSDEIIAKELGLKNVEDYYKILAQAKAIQSREAQEAYDSMAQ